MGVSTFIENNNLSVEHHRVCGQVPDRRSQSREAVIEGAIVAGVHLEPFTVLDRKRTDAIQLELKNPVGIVERFVRKSSEHRLGLFRQGAAAPGLSAQSL